MSSSWANYFFLSIASGIFLPYLPLYLKARGMSASRIGVLLGCLELAGMAGPMLLGRMADRRAAYRGILAVSSVVPMVVMLPLELTTFYPVFVICILVMGFTYRATIPLLDSLVSRIVFDPARHYGRLRVAGSIGFIMISLLLQFTGWVAADSSRAILIAFLVTESFAALAVALLPPAPRLPLPLHEETTASPAPKPAERFDGFDVNSGR